MLRTYIGTLLLLGYHVHGTPIPISADNKILTFSDRIATVFGAKCLKNAGQLEYKEFLEELNDMKKCRFFRFDPPLSGEELSNRCKLYSENVVQCLTKFGEKLEPCLGPNEKYLQQFILEVYNTSAEEFCDYTQMLSVSATLHADTVKCVSKFKEDPKTNPHIVCYENSTLIGDNPTQDIITKEELCSLPNFETQQSLMTSRNVRNLIGSLIMAPWQRTFRDVIDGKISDIQQIDSCFSELLEKHCPDTPKVKEYQRHFARATAKHCTDVSTSDPTETSEESSEEAK